MGKNEERRRRNQWNQREDVLIYGSNIMMKGFLLHNDIEGRENNETEEEEEDRKLTKDKMHKGLESESKGDEQLKKVTIPKKGKGSKAEKPYPTYIPFPIVELPSALAYHAIDRFHTGSMELRLEKGFIKATRQKVQDMLGIPMGSKKLEDLEERPSNDPFIKDTMGTLDNGGRVSTKLLKIITEDVDISNIDWCGYILDCLQTGKKILGIDGEPDEDNETHDHDVCKSTTADANKKKESENQKMREKKKRLINEENGSEATEGVSDGKEENMNGVEREEKQDSNKDENAKVDNVEEKQGDHKDEIGEDEFWNTQFTDSQCEEMENQAKEEIKKKKTAKRKSTKEMTPPSFSLTLSPDTNKLLVFDGRNDFIFETKEGNATIRDYMQTLAPTLKIESNVIDTYCLVLNHEQGVNNKGKKTKHFFHTGMIFKKDDEVKKLKDLEMAFFPIIAHEHYYLVVFNFLKGTTVIIDNSKTPMSYEAKYKKVRDVLGTDAHGELQRENARNWNLEFPTDEEGNRYDITNMRMRFAAKMLSHEINIHREEMSKQALEFTYRNKEKKAREALIRGTIRVKKEKQESERVQSAI
ncbi:ulp1 protease family, C-terminal catalytic domain-containing protein [Tanacetum coccineum]